MKQYVLSSCGGDSWTWVPHCRSLVLPCGTTRRSGRIRFLPRERMALAQIYRFLQRERMVRKQLYSASTSCPLVGALAASCRAGNFGETVRAFLLWWRLVGLGATLSLAGPTMWKEEELHRLDIGGSFVCSHASAWRAGALSWGSELSPAGSNLLGSFSVRAQFGFS